MYKNIYAVMNNDQKVEEKYIITDTGTEWLLGVLPAIHGPFCMELDRAIKNLIRNYEIKQPGHETVSRVEIGSETKTLSVILPVEPYYRDFGMTYMSVANGRMANGNYNAMWKLYINPARIRPELNADINSLLSVISNRADWQYLTVIKDDGVLDIQINMLKSGEDALKEFNDSVTWYNSRPTTNAIQIPSGFLIKEVYGDSHLLSSKEDKNKDLEAARSKADNLLKLLCYHMNEWLKKNEFFNHVLDRPNLISSTECVVVEGKNGVMISGVTLELKTLSEDIPEPSMPLRDTMSRCFLAEMVSYLHQWFGGIEIVTNEGENLSNITLTCYRYKEVDYGKE